jgi:hypothetical protein
LLGASGTSVAARAGLEPTASPDDVRQALTDQLGAWRQRGEHPLATQDVVDAARVLTRTCEGLLAATARADDGQSAIAAP